MIEKIGNLIIEHNNLIKYKIIKVKYTIAFVHIFENIQNKL